MKKIALPKYLHQNVDDDPYTLALEFATGESDEARYTHYRAVAHNNSGRWDAAIWKLHDDGSEELVCTIGMMGLERTVALIDAFARRVFRERARKRRHSKELAGRVRALRQK